MLVKIVHIGNGLFAPVTGADLATVRSFGGEDEVSVTDGQTLDWWKAFRDATGLRIVKPA